MEQRGTSNRGGFQRGQGAWRSQGQGQSRGGGRGGRGGRGSWRGTSSNSTPGPGLAQPQYARTEHNISNNPGPPRQRHQMNPNLGAITGRRRMDLMASVSRSSGLEKDGDDLKNYKTQEEYREFIQEKLDAVLMNHPWKADETEGAKKQRLYEQENVLILFRKLREGVASSDRTDNFALEVYETSFFLSIIFESPKQTTAIMQHLIPSTSNPTTPFTPSLYTPLCSLLHNLVASYPSQGTYHQQLNTIPESLLPRKAKYTIWISNIAKSLRTRNYAKFSVLSLKPSLLSVLQVEIKETKQTPTSKFGQQAIFLLLDSLRQKGAATAWNVLRASYRELSCDRPTNDASRVWLQRSLCLDSVSCFSVNTDLDDWLKERERLGHLRAKEGLEGRWIVCKAR